jgi:hypothetical protein
MRRGRRRALGEAKVNTAHWWFISLSWAATLLVFGALSVAAMLRHRHAKRQLARLESRAPKSRGVHANAASSNIGGPQGGTA